jgi:hypothetical protein
MPAATGNIQGAKSLPHGNTEAQVGALVYFVWYSGAFTAEQDGVFCGEGCCVKHCVRGVRRRDFINIAAVSAGAWRRYAGGRSAADQPDGPFGRRAGESSTEVDFRDQAGQAIKAASASSRCSSAT